MTAQALALMQKKMAAHRARAEVRAWEYRQRKHSKGVWYRLRRILVDATAAYAVDEHQARKLEESGVSALAVGKELHPERTIFMLKAGQVSHLPGLRSVPLHLQPILEEAHLVLVQMED